MLQLLNVSKSYGNKKIFNNINISFSDNAVTAIMGRSGIGKTTLLSIASKIIPFQGEVIGSPENISYIFQTPRLINNLTVYKNINYVLASVIKNDSERENIINKNLKQAEIYEAKNKYPFELSGGEKQRVVLARAFSYPSNMLVMDEPFSSLDIGIKLRLMKVLTSLLKDNNKTCLFVTHDIDEALSIANEIVVLQDNDKYEKLILNVEREKRSLVSEESNIIRKKLLSILSENKINE